MLTRREKEILGLLAEGLTSHEIGTRLYLSNYTVDTYRKHMLQKFNVHNTQALSNTVRRLGIKDKVCRSHHRRCFCPQPVFTQTNRYKIMLQGQFYFFFCKVTLRADENGS